MNECLPENFIYIDSIKCDDIIFTKCRIRDDSLQDCKGLIYYVAVDHGICFCKNLGNRRVQIIHIESWTLITSFETGNSVEKMMPHIAKLAKGFAWNKSYSEIKTLEKEKFDKYFFGVLSQVRKDCGAWKNIY